MSIVGKRMGPWRIACGGMLLAACSGGGGGDEASPPTTLSFATTGTSVAEGAAAITVNVLLRTTLAQTDAEVTVTVADVGTGSAVSGSDYASFAPQVLTFPAGSVDGDMLAVTLSALNDMLVEGQSETARLALTAPSVPIAGAGAFTATITDVNEADVQFTSAATATVAEGSGSFAVIVELDLPPGVTLGVAATVTVADEGTGSAAPGSDYVAFSPRTVTFAAGSPNGATQSVQVDVIDDAVTEIDETLRLVLSTPSAGTQIGTADFVQVTIQDDDSTGPAAFVATQGATGVENVLADDALVDLGSQTVGAGPNAGTLVRVTNAGGSALEISAPHVTGSHPDDFDVTVESAPIVAATDVSTAGDPRCDALSPVAALAGSPGPGVALAFDAAHLEELAPLARASLYAFPLPGEGEVTLQLQRMPLPVSDDAVLRVDGVDVAGGLRPLLGDLSIWTGNVLERPGSRVFLALTEEGPQGFVQLSGSTGGMIHLTRGAAGELRAVGSVELAALGFVAPPLFCQDAPDVPGAPPPAPAAEQSALPGAEMLEVVECRLAIETDHQLYQRFGTTLGTTSYVTQLVAAVSAQYFEDVQTSLVIAYLGVHSNAADGWTSQDGGGDAGDLLDEFRAAWAPGSWPVAANLAHFVSGASLGGGIAYVNVLCSASFGFGVSGNIAGNVNWGTWSGAPGNFTWDFVVVAHELGHNFGSSHTHAYCPPLDQCYANCSGTTTCSQGTIMSYCHTCGGMDNIDLHFHPVTANIMRGAVNASCLGESALLAGDWVQYRVRFDPRGATGQRDATMRFQHDAPNAPQPFRVRLRGLAQ